jgi:hypothetical protein
MDDKERDEEIRELRKLYDKLDKTLFKIGTWVTVLGIAAVALGITIGYFRNLLNQQLDTIRKDIATNEDGIKLVSAQIKDTADKANDLRHRLNRTEPEVAKKERKAQLSKLEDSINLLKNRASQQPSPNLYPAYVEELTNLAIKYLDIVNEDQNVDPRGDVFINLQKTVKTVADGGAFTKDNDPYFRWHTQDAPVGFGSLLDAFENNHTNQKPIPGIASCVKDNLPYWFETLDSKAAKLSRANTKDCRTLGIAWDRVLPTSQQIQ